jgi:hypothetical protein
MTAEPIPHVDELFAAYADDPTSLSAGERAAVEARLAADPAAAGEVEALRAMLRDVRAHGDVGARGTDWASLEAGIRAAVAATPVPRRGRWLAGAGVALAAAAALAVWWQRRDDRPRLDVARLTAIVTAPLRAAPDPPARESERALDPDVDPEHELVVDLERPDPARDPAAAPALAAALDELRASGATDELPLDEADDLDDLIAGGDDATDDVDEEALIGRAIERVPDAPEEDGLLPGLDTAWVDDLSETEVEQALRWLEQQGAG